LLSRSPRPAHQFGDEGIAFPVDFRLERRAALAPVFDLRRNFETEPLDLTGRRTTKQFPYLTNMSRQENFSRKMFRDNAEN